MPNSTNKKYGAQDAIDLSHESTTYERVLYHLERWLQENEDGEKTLTIPRVKFLEEIEDSQGNSFSELSSTTSNISTSSDVDHDATSNRSHSGDDLSPATVAIQTSITDAAGATHTGEIADIADVSPIQSQTDVDHTQISNVTADSHHAAPSAGTAIVDEGTNQFGLDTSTILSLPNGIDSLPKPTGDTQAARKKYVDAIATGLQFKDAVTATTDGSNIDLSTSTDPNPVDGVTLSDGDRVLLKDQTDASQNGLYVASTATDPTTWYRSYDADESSEVDTGMFTFVISGNTNANRGYVLTTTADITLGTTDLNFTTFSSQSDITAGNALSKSSDTLDVVEGDISHDSLDSTTVNPGDHHAAPSAGTGITDEGTNQFGITAGGVGDTELGDIYRGADTDKPASPNTLDIFFDTSQDEIEYYDGSTWVILGGGGGGASSLEDLDNVTVDTQRPASPTTGDVFISTDQTLIERYDGSSWVEIALTEEDISLANLGSNSHTDLADAPTGAHHPEPSAGTGITDEGTNQFGLQDVEQIAKDTAANRPAAGTQGKLFVETDTGRVLYDDGTAWNEVGISENQISLSNLGSNSHADLADAPTGAHHPEPSAGTGITDEGTNQFGIANGGVEDTQLGDLYRGSETEKPTSPTQGDIFFDTSELEVEHYDGSVWNTIANDATASTSTNVVTDTVVDAGNTVTIPAEHQKIVHDNYTIEGELVIESNAELVVL